MGIISFTILLVMVGGILLANTMKLETLSDNAAEGDSLRPQPSFVTRKVASVLSTSAFEEEKPEVTSAMTLDLDCSDRSVRPPIAVQVRQLRLRAQNCELREIKNMKNGFEATLFELGDQKYTSDYISLADGENEIQLVTVPKEGREPSAADIISLRVLTR